jgi:cell division septum initiation protein DivIVA
MADEPAPTFSRKFRGYDPGAVDTQIELLTTKQQLLIDDVEILRARLKAAADDAAALRKENALLTDTSPSPHAAQKRMAQMLRRAVDEVSEMRAEARAEGDALIADAEAEMQAEQRKHEKLLADMAARLEAQEIEYKETGEKLEAELTALRTEKETAIEEAWQKAQQERDQLLAEANEEAARLREQARDELGEARQKRIKILEQLMGAHRDLETVPADLEAAHQEQASSEEADVTDPPEQENEPSSEEAVAAT